MTSKAILILSVFLLMTPKLIFAHGGSHAEEKPTPSLMEETTSLVIRFILLVVKKAQNALP